MSHYVELTRVGRARIAAASPRFRALVDDVAERTERPIAEVTAALDDLERALLAHLAQPVVPTGRRR